MTELMRASNEWSVRPDDERYLTLEDLLAAVDSRKQISRERNVMLRDVQLGYDQNNEITVVGNSIPTATFSHWAMTQFATLTGAPASWLRKLPAPLAKLNMEAGIELLGNGSNETKLYWTDPVPSDNAMDVLVNGIDKPAQLRASTGPTYGRIYDAEVARAVIRMNQDNRWSVPLKAYDGVNSKQATTLYASDRDMFVFLVDETRPIEVDGDTLFRGFYTWNSEVGNATLGISTFLYNRVCANRIIWGARNVEEFKIRHTSGAPGRFLQEAVPALNAISESSTRPIVEAIQAAKQTRIGKTVADVEKWLTGKGFGKFEIASAVKLAARGGDTGSGGDPTNLWDVVGGMTAYAREIKNTDSRIALERQAGALMRADGSAV